MLVHPPGYRGAVCAKLASDRIERGAAHPGYSLSSSATSRIEALADPRAPGQTAFRWRYAALSASNFRMTSGLRSMASRGARAGASGVLRCCSQSRKVVMGK